MNRACLVWVALALGACRAGPTPDPGGAAKHRTAAQATNVLLVANLGEADEPCVCGKLIRAVRVAAKRGVKVREVGTRDKGESAKVERKYRILVTPAVLFLDDKGNEVSRFVGESKEMLDGVDAALGKLANK